MWFSFKSNIMIVKYKPCLNARKYNMRQGTNAHKTGGAVMIISVSSRTDISSYYDEWLLCGLKDGYAYIFDSVKHHRIGEASVSP